MMITIMRNRLLVQVSYLLAVVLVLVSGAAATATTTSNDASICVGSRGDVDKILEESSDGDDDSSNAESCINNSSSGSSSIMTNLLASPLPSSSLPSVARFLHGLLDSFFPLSPPWNHIVALTTNQCDFSMEPIAPPNGSVEFDTIYRWTEVSFHELGYPQYLNPDYNETDRMAILQRLEKAEDYIFNTILKEEKYRLVRDECYNEDEHCAYWAAVHGMCDDNTHADFMHYFCAPVCGTCHELHPETKCPMTSQVALETNAWKRPHDLDDMFERIISHSDFAQYTPKVLSQPKYDRRGRYVGGPWVVTLEDFITDAEADRLIQLGRDAGYERSTNVGTLDEYGLPTRKESDGRTSRNAFCQDPPCSTDAVTLAVHERMQGLTQIPTNYSEHLQLLYYQEGEFYKVHHDYIKHLENRVQGPRILTVFLYLNDVEQGGGTNFDKLGITVQPKKGRAVLWPSVVAMEMPNGRGRQGGQHYVYVKDPRTTHQALPVIKGEKYGANAWIHMRDYLTPFDKGCI